MQSHFILYLKSMLINLSTALILYLCMILYSNPTNKGTGTYNIRHLNYKFLFFLKADFIITVVVKIRIK